MARLTRVRLEADGHNAAEVEACLHKAATELEGHLQLESSWGEQVIERDVAEPMGHTAFRGRMILHPNVADDARQRRVLDPRTPGFVGAAD